MLNRKNLKNMTFALRAVMFFEIFDLSMTFRGAKVMFFANFLYGMTGAGIEVSKKQLLMAREEQ